MDLRNVNLLENRSQDRHGDPSSVLRGEMPTFIDWA